MKKYFVISDIHSFYEPMMKALTEKGFDKDNPEHIIINCGDLCDRGPDSIKCILFMLELYNQDRAILILGNHEDLMEEAIARRYFKGHDIHNRTTITACDLTGEDDPDIALQHMRDNKFWNAYINRCIDFYETDNYVFVHGWIPVGFKYDEDEKWAELPLFYKPTIKIYNPEWRIPTWGDDWKDARWLNGMAMWQQGIREPDKTIVCGHYHTSYGHTNIHDDGVEFLDEYETFYIDPDTGKQEPHVNNDIFYDNGIIALDACTALTNRVNVLVIDEENI